MDHSTSFYSIYKSSPKNIGLLKELYLLLNLLCYVPLDFLIQRERERDREDRVVYMTCILFVIFLAQMSIPAATQQLLVLAVGAAGAYMLASADQSEILI